MAPCRLLLTLLLVVLAASQHIQARTLHQQDAPDEAEPSIAAPALDEDILTAVAFAPAPAPTPVPAPAPQPDPAPAPQPEEEERSPPSSPSRKPEKEPSPEAESPPSPSPEGEEETSPSPPAEEEQSPSPPAEEEQSIQEEQSPSAPSGEARQSRRDGQPSYTTGPVPATDGYKPYPVDPSFRGTCDIKNTDENLGRCDDDMGDLGDGTTPADFKMMHDPDQGPRCGILPGLDDIVNGLAETAYSGQYGGCGITSYTITRVCVGQGDKEGHWRVRVLMWPDSNSCEPLCMKMRGQGDSANDLGRTATC